MTGGFRLLFLAKRRIKTRRMAWVTCELTEPIQWQSIGEWRQGGVSVIGLPLGDVALPPEDQLNSLTPEERQRADRFRQPADRLRFLYGRLLLRWVSYRLTGRPAQLLTGPYGKPDFPADTGWHVNLSHAGDWVLVAVDRQPVGIDVESSSVNLLLDTLLPTICSAAEQHYVRGSQHATAAFLQLWTRKEALLKAIGRGLVDKLDTVPALAGRTVIPLAIDAGEVNWRVDSFAVDSVHTAAVAYQSFRELPTYYRLTASDLLTYHRFG